MKKNTKKVKIKTIKKIKKNTILKRKSPTAPGTDRITYQLIKQLNESWKIKICSLIYHSINKINYNKDISVKIISIPKSYSALTKDFRPIALIPVMTKITNSYVKNVITRAVKNI